MLTDVNAVHGVNDDYVYNRFVLIEHFAINAFNLLLFSLCSLQSVRIPLALELQTRVIFRIPRWLRSVLCYNNNNNVILKGTHKIKIVCSLQYNEGFL
jgi:hypothetical protein